MVALSVVGCDSSTAPSGITPAQLARHIDSLTAAATVAQPNGPRASYLSEVESFPANGVAPMTFLISTAGGMQSWKGFVLKSTLTTYPEPDSIYHFFAYSDFNLTNVLYVQQEFWPYPGTVQTDGYLLADTVEVPFGAGTMTVHTTSIGSACQVLSGLTYYAGTYTPPVTCSLGTFTVGFSLNWPKTPGVDSDLLTLIAPSQPVNGRILH